VKDMDSNSWFIAIKKMLYKYELLDPITPMNNPPRKLEWKKSVDIAFNKYWSNLLIAKCKSYPSLEFLCTDKFQQWKPHRILQIGKNSDPSRETPKISIKLKLLTGIYIFEKNRARYISKSSSICKLCNKEVEDIEHFLLSCPILNSARLRYYSRLDHLTKLLYNEPFSTLSNIKKNPYIIKPLCNTLCIIACSK
jgi:hypothetical protein